MKLWTEDEIQFDFAPDTTDHPVFTLVVNTPQGRLELMGELRNSGDEWRVIGLHIQGGSPNEVGWANLRRLGRIVCGRMGVDGLVVEGAPRTTGANPGDRARHIRFAAGGRILGDR